MLGLVKIRKKFIQKLDIYNMTGIPAWSGNALVTGTVFR